MKKIERITREQAQEMAAENLAQYLMADYGQRLVSDREHPLRAYIQEQNSHSMAGEIFSVNCPGIGNLDMSYWRKGWDCDDLDDADVIQHCCEEGDVTAEIEELADAIHESANAER